MSGLRRLPTARATTERFYVGGNFRPSSDVTEGPFPYFHSKTLRWPACLGRSSYCMHKRCLRAFLMSRRKCAAFETEDLAVAMPFHVFTVQSNNV